MIGYWHDNVVCLSVHLSMTLCIVAKRYILQQNCLNKWIGSALIGTWFYNFQSPNTDPEPSDSPQKRIQFFTYIQQIGLLPILASEKDDRLSQQQLGFLLFCCFTLALGMSFTYSSYSLFQEKLFQLKVTFPEFICH